MRRMHLSQTLVHDVMWSGKAVTGWKKMHLFTEPDWTDMTPLAYGEVPWIQINIDMGCGGRLHGRSTICWPRPPLKSERPEGHCGPFASMTHTKPSLEDPAPWQIPKSGAIDTSKSSSRQKRRMCANRKWGYICWKRHDIQCSTTQSLQPMSLLLIMHNHHWS